MRLSSALPLLPLVSAAPWATKRSEPAPLHLRGEKASAIAGKYIVKFKDNSAMSIVQDAMKIFPEDAEHVFDQALKGFVSSLDEATVAALREHPDVEYIEQDGVVKAYGVVEQKDSTWGLSRVSHREIQPNYTYLYDDAGVGNGMCAYVLDTGIDDSHPDFGGRAKQVKSYIQGEETDKNGHGTHVAGTIGSNTYGVAKGIKLLGVKVLGDNSGGSTSGIVSALDWVLKDIKTQGCPKGAVVNMSLGGGYSKALNEASAKVVKAGYFVSVAAGNEGKDVGTDSPASEPTVCTVGATSDNDNAWQYSNYGKAVDILAPGDGVTSLKIGGSGTTTDSGTSMAAPHVAGLAAYLAAMNNEKPTGAYCKRLQDQALKNVITGFNDDTKNLLAFNGVSQ